MKILMVNKFLHPNGGSETYIFEIGRKLVQMGHEVQFFGMEHEGRIVGNHIESYSADMDFHTGKLSRLFYPFKIIYSIEAKKGIEKVLMDFMPDVVHFNNFNFQLTPSIIYAVKNYMRKEKKQVTLVYTAHDYQLICPNHMLRVPSRGENCEKCMEEGLSSCAKNKCIHNSLLKSILGSLEAWVYRCLRTYQYFDVMICPSFFMKKKLDHNPIFAPMTIVMHNFVNVPKSDKKKNGGFVLYFGRYSQEKGVNTLLEVCRRLPDIPFVFAGSGPLEEKVSMEKNIYNAGFLKGEDLYNVIREAAFSVYPSEWYENCPFSVMESISCSTPVIGADTGGIPELVDDGVTGELFMAGDVEALYEKIRSLWNDKELILKYTNNCGEKKFYTIEEYCRKLLEIYRGQEG